MYTALCIVLFLICAFALRIFWHSRKLSRRFHESPDGIWAERLEVHFQPLVGELTRLKQEYETSFGIVMDAHRAMFESLLESIPVEKLSQFPGIGKATVTKLMDAGVTNLLILTEMEPEEIPDLGEYRSDALQAARDISVSNAQDFFDTRDCPQGRAFRWEIAPILHRESPEFPEKWKRFIAIMRMIDECTTMLRVAEQVTFANWLKAHGQPLVPEELLDADFPVPDMSEPFRPILREEFAPVSTLNFSPRIIPPDEPVHTSKTKPKKLRGVRPTPASKSKPLAIANTPTSAPSPVHPWLGRLHDFTRFGVLVAKADGKIAAAEKRVIRDFLVSKFGQEQLLLPHIDPLIEKTVKESFDERQILAAITTSIPEISERQELFLVARKIAAATGEPNVREKELLRRIRKTFAIPDDPASAPKVEVGPEIKPVVKPEIKPVVAPPAVPVEKVVVVAAPAKSAPLRDEPPLRSALEIEPATPLSVELIRRRWQMMSAKIDPAKVASMGPEFVRLAEDKLATIRRAAETLIAPFNVPLDLPAAPPPPTDIRHNPDLDDVFGG